MRSSNTSSQVTTRSRAGTAPAKQFSIHIRAIRHTCAGTPGGRLALLEPGPSTRTLLLSRVFPGVLLGQQCRVHFVELLLNPL